MFIAKSWSLRGPAGKQRAGRLGTGKLREGEVASTCDSFKCGEQRARGSRHVGTALARSKRLGNGSGLGVQGREESRML